MGCNNGGAYETREQRYGVPMSYASEKLRKAITASARLLRNIDELVPDNLLSPGGYLKGAQQYPVKTEFLNGDAYALFRYQVIAYAALHNMLAVANDLNGKGVDCLLKMTPDDLEAWLDELDRNGSLSGGGF